MALHLGTALTLALSRRSAPRLALLAAATAPPALAGLALERRIEARLGTPPTVAAGLLAGAAAMVAADRAPAGARPPTRAPSTAPGSGLHRHWRSSRASRAAAPHARWLGRAASTAPARRSSRARSRSPVLAGAAALKAYWPPRRRPTASTLRTLAAGAATAAVSTGVALRAERALAA